MVTDGAKHRLQSQNASALTPAPKLSSYENSSNFSLSGPVSSPIKQAQ